MGLSFFKLIRPKTGKTYTEQIECDLYSAGLEFQIRELCFWTCVNFVGNMLARCEVRTWREHKEVKEREYYTWNVEPNTNQNSTAFWLKLVARLMEDNEALIIPSNVHGRGDGVVIADSWEDGPAYPSAEREYRKVQVGDMTYSKTFYEHEIMHLQLHHTNMRSVINALYGSYWRLIRTAMHYYEATGNSHIKVHVDEIAGRNANDENWAKNFQKMISDQVKPFLESGSAVLPEFDGYKYEEMTRSHGDSRDIKNLIEDIFDFTARGFCIPAVLVNGKVEATSDANLRFLTGCLDPLCDQIQEEGNRKRYGYDAWSRGNFLRVDSSSIIHFDLFGNAANIEKLVGSGGFTINDVRRAANQEPINEPWADDYFMTLNIQPVDGDRTLSAQKGGKV